MRNVKFNKQKLFTSKPNFMKIRQTVWPLCTDRLAVLGPVMHAAYVFTATYKIQLRHGTRNWSINNVCDNLLQEN